MALMVAGCASGSSGSSDTAAGTTSSAPETTTPAAAITTSVAAPPDLASPAYAQACADAKQFIAGQGDEAAVQFLGLLQAQTTGDPTSGLDWAGGTEAQRATLIAAVYAAARGQC